MVVEVLPQFAMATVARGSRLLPALAASPRRVKQTAYKDMGVHIVSFIEQWERIPSPEFEPLACRYKVNANAKPYDSSAILGALTYSVSAGIATVLLPPLFR